MTTCDGQLCPLDLAIVRFLLQYHTPNTIHTISECPFRFAILRSVTYKAHLLP